MEASLNGLTHVPFASTSSHLPCHLDKTAPTTQPGTSLLRAPEVTSTCQRETEGALGLPGNRETAAGACDSRAGATAGAPARPGPGCKQPSVISGACNTAQDASAAAEEEPRCSLQRRGEGGCTQAPRQGKGGQGRVNEEAGAEPTFADGAGHGEGGARRGLAGLRAQNKSAEYQPHRALQPSCQERKPSTGEVRLAQGHLSSGS